MNLSLARHLVVLVLSVFLLETPGASYRSDCCFGQAHCLGLVSQGLAEPPEHTAATEKQLRYVTVLVFLAWESPGGAGDLTICSVQSKQLVSAQFMPWQELRKCMVLHD